MRKSLLIIPFLIVLVLFKVFLLESLFPGVPATAKPAESPEQAASEPQVLKFSARKDVAESPFQDMAGNPKTFADYAGKIVIVNLWATWCAPCIKEMPSLARLARGLPADRFRVLAISMDRAGPRAVEEFWSKLDVAGLEPMIDQTTKLGFALQAQGMPTTLVLDRSGKEIARVSGAMDWASPAIAAQLRALAP